MQSRKFSTQSSDLHNRCRSGLTLVEVVAGIALLALLMVSLLEGWRRHRRIIEVSSQKLQAIELLDEQLGRWFATEGGPPAEGQGILPGSDFRWSSSISTNRSASMLRIVPIKIRVSSPDFESLVSVEVVVSAGQYASKVGPSAVEEIRP